MCQLFFIISAFLFYGSYDRMVKKNNGNIHFKNVLKWIAKRFIRLIPIFYLSIIIHILTHSWSTYWLGAESGISIGNIIAHIFFLHGLFPYYIDSITGVEWYVGDITFLILLMPLIYRYSCNTRQSLILLCLFYAISRVVIYCLMHVLPVPIPDFYIWREYVCDFGFWVQMPVMMLGIVLYRYIKQNNPNGIKNAKRALLLFVLSIIIQATMILLGKLNYMVWGGAFLILFYSQYESKLSVVDNRLTRLLGKYSYPIYLFHFGIFMALRASLWARNADFPCN